MDITLSKKCSRHNNGAGEILPASHFYVIKNRQGKPALAGYCKECQSKQAEEYREQHRNDLNKRTRKWHAANPNYRKEWAEQNPEKAAARFQRYRLKRMGISADWYSAKLSEQENCCELCRQPFQDTPAIDHDHACCPGGKSCGKCVRGLLCDSCNQFVGFIEKVTLREAALAYLEKYRRPIL